MADEIPTEALAAAGLAMVPFSLDGQEPDYFEWHECEDQPNCAVKRGQPCACSGMPWPSEAVQAAIAAAAPFLIAEGRRQAAEAIRAEAAREIRDRGWFWFVYGESRLEAGAAWAARIAEPPTDGPTT